MGDSKLLGGVGLPRFPLAEFQKRVRNVRERMERKNLDLLLIFSSPGSMRYGQRGHVMYLSGHEPYFGNTMMILPLDTDIEPLLQIGSADFFPSQFTWVENTVQAQDFVKTVRSFLREANMNRPRAGLVGEYSISPQLIARMRKLFGSSGLSYASQLLEEERSIKSEFEINCIREASNIAKKGLESAAELAKPGLAEHEVISEVERVCRKEGSEEFPHFTMVSSGMDEKHLEKWWYCGSRRMKKRETMNIDFGCMYKGYCCDISRSYYLGKVPKKLRDFYGVLVEAEIAGQKASKPGVLGSEVNQAVIDVMEEHFEGDFTGIGHGVGLEVHEWPFVGYQYIKNDPVYKDRRLEKNMVISLEPQIFDPEVGHVQIEDEFVVTQSGGKILSSIPREIIEC